MSKKGWHHHVVLALLAGLFLLEVEQGWGKKDAVVNASSGGSGAGGVIAETKMDGEGTVGVAGGDAAAKRGGQAGSPEATRPPLPL